MKPHVVVVGASLAGLSTVRELRAQGFDGAVTLLGDEQRLPYDRPPLSKEFLSGAVADDALALVDADELDDLDVAFHLGDPAVELAPSTCAVQLASGRRVVADRVVVATGARAVQFPGCAGLRGVHTLRRLDDACALRAALVPGARLVVIGAGFIGSEVAAVSRRLGLEVTVVEALPVPLAAVLGQRMGQVCAGLHEANGVRLLRNSRVVGMRGLDGRVQAVELGDGGVLPADVVLVGIGAAPVTDWLAGSGVVVRDGVCCDEAGRTSIPGVVAVGDVCRRTTRWASTPLRVEHWTHALEQPRDAVAALLGGPEVAVDAARRAPYFWSEQYGRRLQFAGHVEPGDEVVVVEGDPDQYSFVALYRRDGRDVAVLGMDAPRLFTRLRHTLAARATPQAAA